MPTPPSALLPKGFETDIIKSLRVPLAVLDPEFRFLWLNQEMARIYQTRPSLARGRICYRVASGQDHPCPDCPVAAVQRSGHREATRKYKDFPGGVRKFGDVCAFPVHDSENTHVATILMILDITDKIVVNASALYRQLAHRISILPPMAPASTQVRKKAPSAPPRRPRSPDHGLTQRQTHVLRLLAKGYANTEIAARLKISPHTVKSHVINIFNKLAVNDRTQAAVWAAKHGLIE